MTLRQKHAIKHDRAKLRYDLIPPESLRLLAEVYTMGAAKYAPDNWRKGMEWSRVYGAIQRHLNAFWAGEDVDPESGLPHVAHAAWGCFTLLSYMRDHRKHDTRPCQSEKEK